MIVTMLSLTDYAGSGYKLCEALERMIDIDLFTGPNPNSFNHPIRNIVTEHNIKQVQDRLDMSDVIHLKGDWPPFVYEKHWGVKFNSPVVVSVSGSFFRKRHHGGSGEYAADQYNCHRTAFEPDLCYPDFTDVWMPHPIDSMDKPNSWKQSNILVHSPTNRYKKHSDFIFRVFDLLPECDIRIIEGLDYREAIRQRKEATIFFDQFRVGWYGNAAIEAMQYGVPVGCYISPEAIKQANGQLDQCPVLNDRLEAFKWAEMIKGVLGSDMSELSRATKKWVDDYHSYEAVSDKWIKYYDKLIKG